jgi:transcription antitermination factor NusG
LTLWVIATANGQEFPVQNHLEAMGLRAEVPRKVEALRQGKRRRPDAITSAYLPGYVFAWFDADDWHAIRGAKHVRTMMGVSSQAERLVQAFIDRVEADYADRMARIRASEYLEEYNPGDLLTIMTGPFAGQIARFTRMLETAHDVFPVIEAEIDVFGQTARVKVDPIAARRATT